MKLNLINENGAYKQNHKQKPYLPEQTKKKYFTEGETVIMFIKCDEYCKRNYKRQMKKKLNSQSNYLNLARRQPQHVTDRDC